MALIYCVSDAGNAKIVAEPLSISAQVVCVVYQSCSGRMGLDIDEPVERFCFSFLLNSWLWDPDEHQARVMTAQENIVAMIRRFLSVSILRPNEAVLEEINRCDEFSRLAKKNQLLERLGKPTTVLASPLLYELLDSSGRFGRRQAEFLVSKTEALFKWRFNECGLHFVCVCRDAETFLDGLKSHAAGFRIEVEEVENESALPAW